jgi:hypothetical protein
MQRASSHLSLHNPMSNASRLGWLLLLVVTAHCSASGQNVRVRILNAVTGRPITGAVVTLLDGPNANVTSQASDENGRVSIMTSGATTRLRFLRIGFRPRVLDYQSQGTNDSLDVAMTPIPTMLEPINVRANPSCSYAADGGPAFGLLEQARAGLLNSVVSRKAGAASMIRIGFEQSMDGTSDRIIRQSVRLDSGASATSFNAMRANVEFVTAGFVGETLGINVFYAPDAETLLSEEFGSAYCFHLAKSQRSRPDEVGLAFSVATRVRGRVDIAGILWVDTAQRQLRSLEFTYDGLDRSLDPANPGGSLSFLQLPNGPVVIDRWLLRLPVVRRDSTFNSKATRYVPLIWVEKQQSGGELARAEFHATVWEAHLGSLLLQLQRRDGAPAFGAQVALEDTDYRGVADQNGYALIRRILPGPYRLIVIDSQLSRLGISLATPIKFIANRDSTHRAVLTVPTAESYVNERCRQDRIWKSMPRQHPDVVWIVGRIVGPDGKPTPRASIFVSKGSGAFLGNPSLTTGVVRSLRTGTDGVFQVCPNTLRTGDTVRIRVSHPEFPPVEFQHVLTDSLVILPLVHLGKTDLGGD